MSALLHTLLLLGSIGLAYLWMQIPNLDQYSLQAVALSTILFFVVKYFSRSKPGHSARIIPAFASLEVAILTFTLMLLIGSTGNTESLFYPLTYIHLFFLVLSTYTITAIVTTLGVMLYHYALMPTINTGDITDLIILPIVLVFFLFAKEEHERGIRERVTIAQEETAIRHLEEKVHNLTTETKRLRLRLRSTDQMKQDLIDFIHNSYLPFLSRTISRPDLPTDFKQHGEMIKQETELFLSTANATSSSERSVNEVLNQPTTQSSTDNSADLVTHAISSSVNQPTTDDQ